MSSDVSAKHLDFPVRSKKQAGNQSEPLVEILVWWRSEMNFER
jgi:hypothetical protein